MKNRALKLIKGVKRKRRLSFMRKKLFIIKEEHKVLIKIKSLSITELTLVVDCVREVIQILYLIEQKNNGTDTTFEG